MINNRYRDEKIRVPVYNSIKYSKYSSENNIIDINSIPKYYIDEYFVPITSIVISNIFGVYYISNYGNVYNVYLGRFLSQKSDKDGYLSVSLSSIKSFNETLVSSYCVHRLVLCAFNNISYSYPFDVNHKDLNKQNNNLQNLEWVTIQENRQHAKDNGVFKSMTNEQATQICQLLQDGYNPVEIGKITNIPAGSIRTIKSGRSFKYISKGYNIPKIKEFRKPLPNNEVINICEMLSSGQYTQSEIAKITNVPLYIINGLKQRKFFTKESASYDFSKVKYENHKASDEEKFKALECIKSGETNLSKISREIGISRKLARNIKQMYENGNIL